MPGFSDGFSSGFHIYERGAVAESLVVSSASEATRIKSTNCDNGLVITDATFDGQRHRQASTFSSLIISDVMLVNLSCAGQSSGVLLLDSATIGQRVAGLAMSPLMILHSDCYATAIRDVGTAQNLIVNCETLPLLLRGVGCSGLITISDIITNGRVRSSFSALSLNLASHCLDERVRNLQLGESLVLGYLQDVQRARYGGTNGIVAITGLLSSSAYLCGATSNQLAVTTVGSAGLVVGGYASGQLLLGSVLRGCRYAGGSTLSSVQIQAGPLLFQRIVPASSPCSLVMSGGVSVTRTQLTSASSQLILAAQAAVSATLGAGVSVNVGMLAGISVGRVRLVASLAQLELASLYEVELITSGSIIHSFVLAISAQEAVSIAISSVLEDGLIVASSSSEGLTVAHGEETLTTAHFESTVG